MDDGSGRDDAQVLKVVVQYQFEGRIHELVFGDREEFAIPCSIYFDPREMERAREALGENSMTLLPPGLDWGDRTPAGVTHSVLEGNAARAVALRQSPLNWPAGGPTAFKVCWHSCMCDWWCMAR